MHTNCNFMGIKMLFTPFTKVDVLFMCCIHVYPILLSANLQLVLLSGISAALWYDLLFKKSETKVMVLGLRT